MNTNIETRIKKLEIEKKQLEERHQDLLAKARDADKKIQTKRKIIIGALLLKDIETNEATRKYIIKLLSNAPERDKKIFADLFLSPIIPNAAN